MAYLQYSNIKASSISFHKKFTIISLYILYFTLHSLAIESKTHEITYNSISNNSSSSTTDTIRLLSDNYFSSFPSHLHVAGNKKLVSTPDSLLIPILSEGMGQFTFPFQGKIISPYGAKRRGHLHSGVDIKLLQGDTIKNAFNGKVRLAKSYSGYGLMVVVQHLNGIETLYSHLSKILVKEGDTLQSGYPVGLGGRTGRATTTHLHFEIRFLGNHFDPSLLLDYQNYALKTDTLVAYNRKGKVFFLPKGEAPVQKPTLLLASQSDYYIVQKGDTLYSIARNHGLSLAKLCELNNISSSAILSIGKKLKVK
jgi:murein DD-endopeptidase MepM/ murein hydrolase activator NlpD